VNSNHWQKDYIWRHPQYWSTKILFLVSSIILFCIVSISYIVYNSYKEQGRFTEKPWVDMVLKTRKREIINLKLSGVEPYIWQHSLQCKTLFNKFFKSDIENVAHNGQLRNCFRANLEFVSHSNLTKFLQSNDATFNKTEEVSNACFVCHKNVKISKTEKKYLGFKFFPPSMPVSYQIKKILLLVLLFVLLCFFAIIIYFTAITFKEHKLARFIIIQVRDEQEVIGLQEITKIKNWVMNNSGKVLQIEYADKTFVLKAKEGLFEDFITFFVDDYLINLDVQNIKATVLRYELKNALLNSMNVINMTQFLHKKLKSGTLLIDARLSETSFTTEKTLKNNALPIFRETNMKIKSRVMRLKWLSLT